MHAHTFTGTWMERPGTATTYSYSESKSYTGIRVIAQVWDDAPEVAELRLVKGDGRTPDFELFKAEDVSAENAAATAEAWLDAYNTARVTGSVGAKVRHERRNPETGELEVTLAVDVSARPIATGREAISVIAGVTR